MATHNTFHKNHVVRVTDVPCAELPKNVTAYRLRVYDRVSGVHIATCVAFERHIKIGQNEIHVFGLNRPFSSLNNAIVSILERRHDLDVENYELGQTYDAMATPAFGLRKAQVPETKKAREARKRKQDEIVRAINADKRHADFRNTAFARGYAAEVLPVYDVARARRVEKELADAERAEGLTVRPDANHRPVIVTDENVLSVRVERKKNQPHRVVIVKRPEVHAN